MKKIYLLLLTALLLAPLAALHADDAAKPGFRRRGFYLHGSWVMNYPFAVRTWERQDFAQMFRLLRHLEFNTVMWWPTVEVAPMPLSDEDARLIHTFRDVIHDARQAGLECWVGSCPSVIACDDVRSQPWPERSLYASMKTIRLDDPQRASAYLEHRSKVLKILDNADAFVVIDGDPGGYPGAPVEEYMRILKSDQQAVPGKRVIPWIWAGWGRDHTKGGYWKQPVTPHVEATLDALKEEMTGEWELLPGRSHRDGWANGRVNIKLVEKAGLMSRSTLMCYEVIEFEPTQPAAVIQFDIIRRVLNEESHFADIARGIFGNAQQPVMVLPNLYFFARGAADLSYLQKPDDEVLADLAEELGGDPEVLVPTWSCLNRSLDGLPAELADQVRSLKLDTDFAKSIPGGPKRYLDILASQLASRRELLEAVAEKPANIDEAAKSLAQGAIALLRWWHVHRYVGMGRKGDPFRWRFIHPGQVTILGAHAKRCASFGPDMETQAAKEIAATGLLSHDEAAQRIQELTGSKK